jgi:hypothetical protein
VGVEVVPVAGVLVLPVPRIPSFVTDIYLTFVGLIELNGIYHLIARRGWRLTMPDCYQRYCALQTAWA